MSAAVYNSKTGQWDKYCRKCDSLTSVKHKADFSDFFGKTKSHLDGLYHYCKKCCAEKDKKRIRPNRYNEVKKSNEKFPEKSAARELVNRSVRLGVLTRPESCQKCGIKTKTQGHHEDYSKPLEVMWLCTRCHGAQHRAETEANV